MLAYFVHMLVPFVHMLVYFVYMLVYFVHMLVYFVHMLVDLIHQEKMRGQRHFFLVHMLVRCVTLRCSDAKARRCFVFLRFVSLPCETQYARIFFSVSFPC